MSTKKLQIALDLLTGLVAQGMEYPTAHEYVVGNMGFSDSQGEKLTEMYDISCLGTFAEKSRAGLDLGRGRYSRSAREVREGLTEEDEAIFHNTSTVTYRAQLNECSGQDDYRAMLAREKYSKWRRDGGDDVPVSPIEFVAKEIRSGTTFREYMARIGGKSWVSL